MVVTSMNVLGSVSRFERRTTAGRRVPPASSFFQTFPKICGSNAKLFQGFLWRFCVISETYNRSKSHLMVSKLLASIARTKSQPRGQIRSGSLKGHANTVAWIVFFRKKNRRRLCPSGTRAVGDSRRPRSRRRPSLLTLAAAAAVSRSIRRWRCGSPSPARDA